MVWQNDWYRGFQPSTFRVHEQSVVLPLAPTSSVFNDDFVNGTSFEFGYNRPSTTNKEDDKRFFRTSTTKIMEVD